MREASSVTLTHAYGAAFDNPELVALCVVGDGEAEITLLAASWHSNKFLDPKRDGAVLPVLHLNGFKIANPTVLARIPHDELAALLEGLRHLLIFVEGSGARGDAPASRPPSTRRSTRSRRSSGAPAKTGKWDVRGGR